MGAYKIFAKVVEPPVNTILECGSRDALDIIHLAQQFNSKQNFCFECNPAAIEQCRKNIADYPQIELVPKGVWNKNTTLDFFPINVEESYDPCFPDGNIGASSFRAIALNPLKP